MSQITPGDPPNDQKVVIIKEINYLKQIFVVEIGYGGINAWIEWVRRTIRSLNHSSCFACTSQCVQLPRWYSFHSVGLGISQEQSTWLHFTRRKLPGEMKSVSFSLLFPPLHSRDFRIPPVFSIAVGIGLPLMAGCECYQASEGFCPVHWNPECYTGCDRKQLRTKEPQNSLLVVLWRESHIVIL